MELVINTLKKKHDSNIVSETTNRDTIKNDILLEIQIAESMFNMASTSKEIEASIYRMQSAELRYKAFILLEKDCYKTIN